VYDSGANFIGKPCVPDMGALKSGENAAAILSTRTADIQLA
jgi:hypothetical protein